MMEKLQLVIENCKFAKKRYDNNIENKRISGY